MEWLAVRLTDSELSQLHSRVCEPLSVTKEWAVISIIEMCVSDEHRSSFVRHFLENYPEDIPPINQSTFEVKPEVKEIVVYLSKKSNQPQYKIVRGMVRYYLMDDHSIMELRSPEVPDYGDEFEIPKPKTRHEKKFQEKFGVDGAVRINEEEARSIIEDDIMGLGSNEVDICSVCEKEEMKRDGMCASCLDDRGMEGYELS